MQSVELRVVNLELEWVVLQANLLWSRAQADLFDLVHQLVFSVADEGLEALSLFIEGKKQIFFVAVFAKSFNENVIFLVFDVARAFFIDMVTVLAWDNLPAQNLVLSIIVQKEICAEGNVA